MVLERPANTQIIYHIHNSVEGMKPLLKFKKLWKFTYVFMFMYVDMNMQFQHAIV